MDLLWGIVLKVTRQVETLLNDFEERNRGHDKTVVRDVIFETQMTHGEQYHSLRSTNNGSTLVATVNIPFS